MLCERVEKEAEIEFGKPAGSLSLKIDSEVRGFWRKNFS